MDKVLGTSGEGLSQDVWLGCCGQFIVYLRTSLPDSPPLAFPVGLEKFVEMFVAKFRGGAERVLPEKNIAGKLKAPVPITFEVVENKPKPLRPCLTQAHRESELEYEIRRHHNTAKCPTLLNKATFKTRHWKARPTTGFTMCEGSGGQSRGDYSGWWGPVHAFWKMIPEPCSEVRSNRLNRPKERPSLSRRIPVAGRLVMDVSSYMRVYVQMQASDTHEYPSLIDTYWRTHTIDGVFPNDGDRRIYRGMRRLEGFESRGGFARDSGGRGWVTRRVAMMRDGEDAANKPKYQNNTVS
ncbi:hypothetical protein Tco_1482297 [Tanacetum coccineum]